MEITKRRGWRMPWNGAMAYKVLPPRKTNFASSRNDEYDFGRYGGYDSDYGDGNPWHGFRRPGNPYR